MVPIGGKRRCAIHVLGTRNVHARVLGEETVGLEEDTDMLHGHTAKPKQKLARVVLGNANPILTPASLPGAECVLCL